MFKNSTIFMTGIIFSCLLYSNTVADNSFVRFKAKDLKAASNSKDYSFVLDKTTGLIWEFKNLESIDKKVNYSNPHDRDNLYSWHDAEIFIKSLNGSKYGGYSNWRMPTLNELKNILSKEIAGENALNIEDWDGSFIWSADTDPKNLNNAFMIHFYMGEILSIEKNYKFGHLYAVSYTGENTLNFPLNSDYMNQSHLSQKFCDPTYPFGEHKGIDINVPDNKPVFAVCKGTVVLNWTNTEEIPKYKNNYERYWNAFIIIKHNCNGKTVYGHYGHIISDLENTSIIEANDPIGYIRKAYDKNNIRIPSSDHLHFGLNVDQAIKTDWGIAQDGTRCQTFIKEGWTDPIKYFNWPLQ